MTKEEIANKVVGFLPNIRLKTATLAMLAASAIITIIALLQFVSYLFVCAQYGANIINLIGGLANIGFNVALFMFFATLWRNQK